MHRKCNATVKLMKTASIPSLRVTPELRNAAESVLRNGESLSSFVEKSIRAQIDLRHAQQAFITRGLAAQMEARKTGAYHSAEDILAELDEMLSTAESKTPDQR